MFSGTSVVGEVTSSIRPSRSTLKRNSTVLITASAGSSCDRSTELIDGRYASTRGTSSNLVLDTLASAFHASA